MTLEIILPRQLTAKQIAGILARRIECWVDIGDELVIGQRDRG